MNLPWGMVCTRISYLLHCQSAKPCVLLTSDNREESACLTIPYPSLFLSCTSCVLEPTFLSAWDWLKGAGHATSQKELLGSCGLWGTTLGSPLVLRTRAETWVFLHNPRPLVFFLLHNPHFSSLCSLSGLKPKVLPKGILFTACDWWKAVNCGTSHIDSSEAVVYVISSGPGLGVTRLRLVTPWVYPIHNSFLGVYLSRIASL